jgi:CelD/BcsL family acetyltransferase involved in cellulose biosynthesis
LEQLSADPSAYTAYDWVQAWAEIYRTRRLILAHAVKAGDGDTAALGLIEVDRIRGWRFVGGDLSPRRAPLCAAGHEEDMWHALANWLYSNPRAWSTLEACEVGPSSDAVPGARLLVQRTPCLALPDSFDSYLASLSSKRRNDMRRRLRLAERAGAIVQKVPIEERGQAIADFVRLHRRRAGAKGEQHPGVDERLAQLLAKISTTDSIDLSIFEVRHGGARVAINIHLEYGGIIYPYNLGWEPEAAHLAPGILLALHAIADAIARGIRTIDLGPGEQDYKLALGFTPEQRIELRAVNPSMWGRVMKTTGAAYQRLRPLFARRNAAISR